MVVDKYVSRCLDVGSTPTGSIIPLHSFAFLGKTLLNQRFLFLPLVFLGILLRKKDTTKDTTFLSYPRNLCTSQSVLRCRLLLALLCVYKRSWSFSSLNVLTDVGLASKSYQRQNKGWHVYV